MNEGGAETIVRDLPPEAAARAPAGEAAVRDAVTRPPSSWLTPAGIVAPSAGALPG